jgi:hypothetical protein
VTLDDILTTLQREADTLHQFGVVRIGVFGSHRHNRAHADSDIDVLVRFQQPSFDAYMNTKLFLEDTFGRSVDLVIEDDVRDELRPRIFDEVVYITEEIHP